MKMSMLVTFYSSNYEHDPATFYQGCGSLKSQKDDLSNITKLVLSQVWWLDVAICTLISSVQLLSCVRVFVAPCIAACQASLSITNSQSLLKLMSMERVMTSNISSAVVPFSSLLHPFQLIIKIFSSESVFRIRWPKYWSFNFSISPSNQCSGLISFRMDQLDLLAVQGILKRLLQHHSSKASILRRKS